MEEINTVPISKTEEDSVLPILRDISVESVPFLANIQLAREGKAIFIKKGIMTHAPVR